MPLLVFMIATLGGGWLYGELLVFSGQERLPYYDLPYIMVALMIFESPGEVPPEPYLIIFWYAMPVIAVYVIGRGVADFVRLFFNRTERKDAWEEALASTYRHHVIVLGVGHVGIRVVRQLVDMGFDVVTIDYDLKPEMDRELGLMDTPCVTGDGRDPNILEKAGLRYAQSLIICTSNDHVNLEMVMRARDMNPEIRIIVRMWDDQFANQVKRFMNVDGVISSSNMAAPAFAGMAVGIQVSQTLQVNGVEYSMIQLEVAPNSFLDKETISRLQKRYDMDIVLHGCDGELDVHPEGDVEVNAGDTLVIFAQHKQITDIVARNRPDRSKRNQKQ